MSEGRNVAKSYLKGIYGNIPAGGGEKKQSQFVRAEN